MTYCTENLPCQATHHKRTCPRHWNNKGRSSITDADFESLAADLEQGMAPVSELRPAERREVARLVALADARISFTNWTLTLLMRYPRDRWELIVTEASYQIALIASGRSI